MIALLLSLLTACAAEPAQVALEAGVAAQRAGDTPAAIAAYTQCLALDPTLTRCRWELGWSHWTDGSWDDVVAAWTAVQAADPAWPELDPWLAKAKAHQAELARIRAAAASAPATVSSALPAGRTVRLRAVGDVMISTDFPAGHLLADDGVGYFDAVAPLLRDADVTFANLEGPLCDGGTTKKCKPDSTSCYAFRTPTRYAARFAEVGIDLASTANNHSGDFGETCRRETEATLDRLGIAWSGPPGSIGTFEADGVRIALVAFHSSASCNYINNHTAAAELVGLAGATHDLVVVSFHGGAEGKAALHVPDHMEEFYGEKRGHLRTFARAVIAAGADVVIGHGPHVPRGMEVVDGHLVAYSLGNFATYDRFNLSGANGLSLVLEVTLDHEGKLVAGQILPVKQVGRGVPQPDPEGDVIGLIRELSQADFPTTAPQIGQDGTFAPR